MAISEKMLTHEELVAKLMERPAVRAEVERKNQLSTTR